MLRPRNFNFNEAVNNLPKEIKESFGIQWRATYLLHPDLQDIVSNEDGVNYNNYLSVNEASCRSKILRAQASKYFISQSQKNILDEVVEKYSKVLDRVYVREEQVDADYKRFINTLSRIAVLGDKVSEITTATETLESYGETVGNETSDLLFYEEAFPALTEINGVNGFNILDLESIEKGLKARGIVLPEGGLQTVYESEKNHSINFEMSFEKTNLIQAPLKSFHSYTNIDNANQLKINNQISYVEGSIKRNFDILETNLLDGMDKFDMIFIDGKSVRELYGNTKHNDTTVMSGMLFNEIFNGNKRIQCSRFDAHGNLSELMKVTAGDNLYQEPKKPLNKWQNFWSKRGFYNEKLTREQRQNLAYSKDKKPIESSNKIKETLKSKKDNLIKQNRNKISDQATVLKNKVQNNKKDLALSYDTINLPSLIHNEAVEYFKGEPLIDLTDLCSIALYAEGKDLNDIQDANMLTLDRSRISTQIKTAFKERDDKYFQDIVTKSFVQIKDAKMPYSLDDAKGMMKAYQNADFMVSLSRSLKNMANISNWTPNLEKSEIYVCENICDKINFFYSCINAVNEAYTIGNTPPNISDGVLISAVIAKHALLSKNYDNKYFKDTNFNSTLGNRLNNATSEVASFAIENKKVGEEMKDFIFENSGRPIVTMSSDNNFKIAKPISSTVNPMNKSRQRIFLDLGNKKDVEIIKDKVFAPQTAKIEEIKIDHTL